MIELDALSPNARELARLASAAGFVNATLLRLLRTEFLPDADAADEAAVWWADIADSRGVNGLTFRPDVLDVLRRELAGDPRRDDVCRVVDTLHATGPALLLLEEQVVALALEGKPADVVEGRLAVAVKALRDREREKEVLAWAQRSLRRLPEAARDTLSAFALESAVKRAGFELVLDANGSLRVDRLPAIEDAEIALALDGNTLVARDASSREATAHLAVARIATGGVAFLVANDLAITAAANVAKRAIDRGPVWLVFPGQPTSAYAEVRYLDAAREYAILHLPTSVDATPLRLLPQPPVRGQRWWTPRADGSRAGGTVSDADAFVLYGEQLLDTGSRPDDLLGAPAMSSTRVLGLVFRAARDPRRGGHQLSCVSASEIAASWPRDLPLDTSPSVMVPKTNPRFLFVGAERRMVRLPAGGRAELGGLREVGTIGNLRGEVWKVELARVERSTDVMVVFTLQRELEAFLAGVAVPVRTRQIPGGTVFPFELLGDDGRRLTCAATLYVNSGLQALIEGLQPAAIVLAGLAASASSDIRYGDVVLADRVLEPPVPDSIRLVPTSDPVVIDEARSLASRSSWEFAVHVGTVAVASYVSTPPPGVLAIDLEGTALAPVAPALIVRAIADRGPIDVPMTHLRELVLALVRRGALARPRPKPQRAISDLLVALADRDPMICFTAARELGERDIGIDAVLAAASLDPIPAMAARRVIGAHAGRAASVIIDWIERRSWQEGVRAAELCAPELANELAPYLTSQLGSGDPDRVRLCITALGRMVAYEFAEAIADLIEHRSGDSYYFGKYESFCVEALVKIFARVPYLGSAAMAAREYERGLAACVEGKGERNPHYMERLWSLAPCTAMHADEAAKRFLRSKLPALRSDGARIIGYARHESATAALAELLHDRDEARVDVEWALARIGTPQALDLLLFDGVPSAAALRAELLPDDMVAELVRRREWGAIRAAGLRPSGFDSAISSALSDKEPVNRGCAALALARRQGAAVLPTLMTRLVSAEGVERMLVTLAVLHVTPERYAQFGYRLRQDLGRDAFQLEWPIQDDILAVLAPIPEARPLHDIWRDLFASREVPWHI